MKHYYQPLALLSLMFLMVGALFCMNDILLPSLVTWFHLDYAQATLIQFSFYLTYIIFPIPIAWLIHRRGYKVSLVTALLTCALGCALFLPAKYFNSYPLVLSAIFVISTGLTIINVAANPFAAMLGTPEGAHKRINFVQIFSRVGYAATPLIATSLIYEKSGAIRFHFPYVILAAILTGIAILFGISRLPSMQADGEEQFTLKGIVRECMGHRHLFYGFFAMFFYMGAEACTAGFFIPYLKSVMGYTDKTAAAYLTLYYICTALMGIAALFLLNYIKAHRLVGYFSLGMLALYAACILLKTPCNGYLMAALGLFLSIMFPTLFSLAIEDIGDFTSKGSALLNFAIIGGSVFPPLQGLWADHYGVQTSYWIPFLCFVMIAVYAFYFTREPLRSRNANSTI